MSLLNTSSANLTVSCQLVTPFGHESSTMASYRVNPVRTLCWDSPSKNQLRPINTFCNCSRHPYVHVITIYLTTDVFDKEQSCPEHTGNTLCSDSPSKNQKRPMNTFCSCSRHPYVHVITIYLTTDVFDKEQSCPEHTGNTACPVNK